MTAFAADLRAHLVGSGCRHLGDASFFPAPAEDRFMRAQRHGRNRSGRLRVDPVRCEAVGVCLHVAPALIRADRWGFPIIAAHMDIRADRRAARAAVASYPRRALFIHAAEADSQTPS